MLQQWQPMDPLAKPQARPRHPQQDGLQGCGGCLAPPSPASTRPDSASLLGSGGEVGGERGDLPSRAGGTRRCPSRSWPGHSCWMTALGRRRWLVAAPSLRSVERLLAAGTLLTCFSPKGILSPPQFFKTHKYMQDFRRALAAVKGLAPGRQGPREAPSPSPPRPAEAGGSDGSAPQRGPGGCAGFDQAKGTDQTCLSALKVRGAAGVPAAAILPTVTHGDSGCAPASSARTARSSGPSLLVVPASTKQPPCCHPRGASRCCSPHRILALCCCSVGWPKPRSFA